MQTKRSIQKLLNYIYLLLAAAGCLLLVIATFFITQGNKTSQQEQMLSNYLLPTIFDLQRLDREIVEFQRMHSDNFEDLDEYNALTDTANKKSHILTIHMRPIQRFIKNINSTGNQAGIKTLQSAMDRLRNNHRRFEASLDEFINSTTPEVDTHKITQSIQSLNISVRQVTRLHQREANKLASELNDVYHSGLLRFTSVVAFTVLLGAIVSIRIISLTKSAIKRQQKNDMELLQHRDNLEQLVQERTSELEATNKELHSYSYSIAHDLRAPLRAITGFSQILLADASYKLNDDEKDDLTRISDAGIRMAELIDDILKLSTVTRAELKYQKTNLSEIALASIKLHGQSNPDQTTDIRIQENIFANADPQLIRLSIDHLLGNAIKYSSEKENAIVEFGTEEIDNETTYFVRDNGIGFDMRYIEKLFQAFERVQDKNSLDGSGIGLALVQRVITKHGGRIWANAAIGQGATFYFTLPDNYHSATTAALSLSRP